MLAKLVCLLTFAFFVGVLHGIYSRAQFVPVSDLLWYGMVAWVFLALCLTAAWKLVFDVIKE